MCSSAFLPALSSAWLDASERLAYAGQQLADDLDSLQGLIERPELLSSLTSVPGLHAHLVAAQSDQVHLLVMLATDLVRNTLASLLADLERQVELHPDTALQSLLSLYAAEHVRLLIAVDKLQRSIRIDRKLGEASRLANQLRSVLSDSHEFKQIMLDLTVLP